MINWCGYNVEAEKKKSPIVKTGLESIFRGRIEETGILCPKGQAPYNCKIA
jgi:hypothetical protein